MIVTSTILEDHSQKDGRRAITERHTFDDGTYQDVSYLAEPKDDVKAMLGERAKQIEADAAQRQAEIEREAAAPPVVSDAKLRAVLEAIVAAWDKAHQDEKFDETRYAAFVDAGGIELLRKVLTPDAAVADAIGLMSPPVKAVP